MAEEIDAGWGCDLSMEWLVRAVENVQIRWWHLRTGFGVDEGTVEESEFRRDERLVAASEVRFIRANFSDGITTQLNILYAGSCISL
jgi:hypothetical protein